MVYRRRPIILPPGAHRHVQLIRAYRAPTIPVTRTILPHTIVPASIPPRLPPRGLSGHPLGTLLTVPTFGPLPPVPVTIQHTVVPTIRYHPTFGPPRPVAPFRRVVAAPPIMVRRPPIGVPFTPGMPLARAPQGPHHRVQILYR